MPFDKCYLCPKDAPAQLVYGPVDEINGKYVYACDDHRKDKNAKIERTGVREAQQAKKAKKMTMDAWFKHQLSIAPKKCECGCGEKLWVPGSLPDRTIVSHILDKKNFPTVATHPENRCFLTWQHHSDWERAAWADKEDLPIAELSKQRVAKFYHLLTENEKTKVPNWLKP